MSGSQTEEPTPRRLRRAREEGDSGASAYASQAASLVAGVLLAPATVTAIGARVGTRLREGLATAAAGDPVARFDPWRTTLDVLELSLPLLLATAAVAGAAQLVQTGGFVATRRIGLRVDRLDPFHGIASLLTRARLFTVARALVGGAFVAYLVVHAVQSHAADLARVSGRGSFTATLAATLAKKVAWDAAFAGLGLALVDLLVTHVDWRRRLRMSRDEVRRERKESEGDPRMKEARARVHRELDAWMAIARVPDASVVVAGPGLACALRYDVAAGDTAPIVLATGEGELAARIMGVSRLHAVPVVIDQDVMRALRDLEIGDPVPEALYESVAAILRGVLGVA